MDLHRRSGCQVFEVHSNLEMMLHTEVVLEWEEVGFKDLRKK